MKSDNVKYIVLIFKFFFVFTCSFAQTNPSYQLNVESGGHVSFNLYSLEYYNNGMNYLDYTRLRIVYTDTTSGTQTDKWYLGVKTQDTEFLSSYPGRTLELGKVTIEASDGGGYNAFNAGEIVSGELTLSNNYVALVESADEGAFILSLSYRLDSVLGKAPGFYNTNLLFKMDTVPFPW